MREYLFINKHISVLLSIFEQFFWFLSFYGEIAPTIFLKCCKKIWKNQNFKISWIIILDIPLGMPHTKFEPNWMKTLGYIKLFPKFKLKIWYVFYIKGFQPLGLWLAITSRKINIFQNFQKILKDIFIYNNILKF